MAVTARITATYLDGRRLADWLEAEGLITEEFTPEFLTKSQRDSFNRWKKGVRAELGYVDRLLTSLYRHIEELPDDVFLEDRRKPNQLTAETQERIVLYRSLGWTFREIAAMVGANRETVRYYVRKAAAA